MNRKEHVAHGLAAALLAGPWERAAMAARTKAALGSTRASKWLEELLDETLTAYRDPPSDRPRELAAHLQSGSAWGKAWKARRRPRIVRWTPVPTAVVERPWPIAELPAHDRLARLLDLDQGELAWFADVRGLERRGPEPLRHYRWTTLPKRDGVRLVAAPKPRLKEIQRRLLRHVLDPIPVHETAHGCVRGRSVRTALTPHVGADVLIRFDLQAFFTSIPAGRVWNLLRVAGVPEGVAHTITGLVTTVVPSSVLQGVPLTARDHRLTAPHLPTGAPTSPALANLVAFTLDRRLAGLAARFDARYTRYVDDLTFSGGPSLRRAQSRFVELVTVIAREEGFVVNERKTVVLGRSGRQALLGAVVNDHLTIPRPERDALRALLHNCAVHGWRTQVRDHDDLRAHVLGRINWAATLDPRFGATLRAEFDAIDWS